MPTSTSTPTPDAGSHEITAATSVSNIASTRHQLRRLSLVVYHRNGAQVLPLEEGEPVIIGRRPDATICIPDHGLSRYHARFCLDGNQVSVHDLRSKNGTSVNGQIVNHAVLRLGDEVALGPVSVSLHVLTPAQFPLRGIESYDRFHQSLAQEVLRSKVFGRKVALLMVRPALRGEPHLDRWCQRIQDLLRPIDQVGLYAPDTIQISIPEADLSGVLGLARAIVSEGSSGGNLSGPILLAGLGIYPDSAGSTEQLIEITLAALQSASCEQPLATSASLTQTSSTDPAKQTPPQGAMAKIFSTVKRLASSPISVLIVGETGVGKELVARAVHNDGPRRGRPMQCINCGSIPKHLIESTLFGHERGAFTGADAQAKGIFEVADGGTLFLDEIGELPLEAQAVLLRVLETKRVRRVGSTEEIPVDVRVVAATHRNLEEMCESGAFRSDLLYRMNTMVLQIPPLRERREEIDFLAHHFLEEANRASARSVREISADARDMLLQYGWPGNIRELRNVIDRAVVVTESDSIGPHDLPERIRTRRGSAAHRHTPDPEETQPAYPLSAVAFGGTGDLDRGRELTFRSQMAKYEASLISLALGEAGWNQTEAARSLQMPRRTLVHKISSYGIPRPSEPSDPSSTVRPTSLPATTVTLGKEPFKAQVDRHEENLLRSAMAASSGDTSKAAKRLGMAVSALAYKLRKHGI